MMRLSIIVPFLNEEENIPRLYARLDAVARTLPDVMTELVLVDDGSTDGSAAAVRALPRTGPSVRLVRLSRNFGSHAALAAGASCATGDVMTFISADMQDPPEILASLLEKWREGHEIVWATREGRDDPWSTKLFARVYHALMRRFALSQMPPGGVDLCLVDRRVVESLGNLQERNSSIFCLLLWAGYSQCVIPYRREARKAGRSKWTLSKKVKLFIDSFVAFSFLPLRLISGTGALLALLGLCGAVVVLSRALLLGVPVQGWAPVMAVLLFCSGLQLLMLGIASEYLWRTLESARDRPPYLIREVEVLECVEESRALRTAANRAGAATGRA